MKKSKNEQNKKKGKNKAVPPVKSGKGLTTYILILLFSAFFILFGLFFKSTWTAEDYPDWVNFGVTTIVLGNGFDQVCNLVVDTAFNDIGELRISFDLPDAESEPQDAWVLMFDPYTTFSWEISGNIQHRELTFDSGSAARSQETGMTQGSDKCYAVFKLQVDGDAEKEVISIQMPEEYWAAKSGDTKKIRAPIITSFFPSKPDLEELNLFMEGLKNGEIEMNGENEIAAHFFSFLEMDGVPSSTAVLEINGLYNPSNLFNRKLTNVNPDSYDNLMGILLWRKVPLLFHPVIEFEDNEVPFFEGPLKFLMVGLGSFFFPIAAEGIYQETLKPPTNRKKKDTKR